MSGSTIFLGIAAIVGLVGANAFFVAAEFALVASRRTRIDAMVTQGDRQAKFAQKAMASLDRYISGTQLGITLASLGLGWIGEPIVAELIGFLFEGLPAPFDVIATHVWAGTIAFIMITFLHIVLGELAPKALALLHPERTARVVAAPLIVFTISTNPFIWVLNGAANALLRLFGARPPDERERVHSPEELVMLIHQSQRSGHLEPGAARVIARAFEFSDKTADDVMTPRTEILALGADMSVEAAADRIAEGRRSRYPVTGESLDDIVGIALAKDVLHALRTAPRQRVSDISRPPVFVPSTRAVENVLADMKTQQSHMAIVLDEFGGTAGLVTMENLLEELVGQILDEFDEADASPLTTGETPVVSGRTSIDEVNRRFGLAIDDTDYNTIGGHVFGALGRLPTVGDVVPVAGGAFEVIRMKARRVGLLRFRRASETADRAPLETS